MEDRDRSTITELGQLRRYNCIGDSALETDYNARHYDLLCQTNGVFEDPNWPKCLPSERFNPVKYEFTFQFMLYTF